MGRSKNRNRTRITSNQRLRSTSNAAPFSPSPVPYRSYKLPRGLPTPSPTPLSGITVRQSRNLYAENPTPTPRKLPRSQPGRLRLYQPTPSGVRNEKPASTRESPQTPQDKQTLVCVRRHQRREILHATKKTGKGGQATPIFTLESKIICRRKK